MMVRHNVESENVHLAEMFPTSRYYVEDERFPSEDLYISLGRLIIYRIDVPESINEMAIFSELIILGQERECWERLYARAFHHFGLSFFTGRLDFGN